MKLSKKGWAVMSKSTEQAPVQLSLHVQKIWKWTEKNNRLLPGVLLQTQEEARKLTKEQTWISTSEPSLERFLSVRSAVWYSTARSCRLLRAIVFEMWLCCASRFIWMLTEWNCLLSSNRNRFGDGASMHAHTVWVQWIAQIALGHRFYFLASNTHKREFTDYLIKKE